MDDKRLSCSSRQHFVAHLGHSSIQHRKRKRKCKGRLHWGVRQASYIYDMFWINVKGLLTCSVTSAYHSMEKLVFHSYEKSDAYEPIPKWKASSPQLIQGLTGTPALDRLRCARQMPSFPLRCTHPDFVLFQSVTGSFTRLILNLSTSPFYFVIFKE